MPEKKGVRVEKGTGWRGRDWSKEELEGWGWMGRERWRGQTLHTFEAEEINKKKHTYPKAADFHPTFYGTTLRLLLLTLPRGSAQ